MAFSVGTLSAFVKENLDKIWVDTVDYTDTLKLNGPIAMYTNVKVNSFKLPKLAHTVTFQDGDNCTFAASGDTTITQATIANANHKVNNTWCVRELEDKFTVGYLPAGQHYDGLGAIENDILSLIIQGMGNKIEDHIWTAEDGVGEGQIDGWKEQIEDAITAVTITATSTGALTTANTLGFVEGLKTAALADKHLARMAMNGGLNIFLGIDAWDKCNQNYRTTHGQYMHAQDFGAMQVQGSKITLRPVSGLTGTDIMVMAQDQNLTFICDLLSDQAEYRFYPDEDDENIRGKARWKMGVGFQSITRIKVHMPA